MISQWDYDYSISLLYNTVELSYIALRTFMKLTAQSPTKSLNKAYLKEKIGRNNIEAFKKNLILLLDSAKSHLSEETIKDYLTQFLRNTWYHIDHAITINNERQDLCIHSGKSTDSVGVIIEVKKMDSSEMISESKPNVKALHELVLYYLKERITIGNNEIKFLLATDINKWVLFDANEFDKKIYNNPKIRKLYQIYVKDKKDNIFFYEEIKKILSENDETFTATYFNLNDYKKTITNTDKEDDKKLIALYKIFSPTHLLKLPFANDSNSLNKDFYSELLHIIGLEEIKDGGKKLIQRKKDTSEASLLENAIIKLKDKDCLRDISEVTRFGHTTDEQYYNIALELCITWINRILFLKLLEAQLYIYQQGDKEYLFLNDKLIPDYDELNNLFLQVLAEKPETRRERLKTKFSKVPYLNSSLFERTELERKTIDISALDNGIILPLYDKTILKETSGKRRQLGLSTLSYLFAFLDSYDFSSEGNAEIQEENKTLINASVLGLIFEKINGYKEGSFFTPGFITMYICRQTLRQTVVQKFNETNNWNCKTLEDVQEKIEFQDKEKRQQANNIINSLTICDIAVGSGHFLVSALNELISIKHELKILQYRHNWQRIKEYSFEIVNDELIIEDIETEDLFEYTLNKKGNIKPELQHLQETLFHEKETLIENCLFGVDINANSVKICRLRLWIELLKNSYYTKESNYAQLETLPNIDINIKQGNSLISRFHLDDDLTHTLQKNKWTIDSYKIAVQTYRNAQSKGEKREMEEVIDTIKKDFRSDISTYDPINKKLNKFRGELMKMKQEDLFSSNTQKKIKANKELEKLSRQIAILEKEKEDIQNNSIYREAFEWRFEFPEVLDNDGRFIGFDAVIGNPPYIQLQKMGNESEVLGKHGFETFTRTGDIYQLFYEQGVRLLKQNGHLGYITSNKWMRTNYGSVTRKFLSEKCNTFLVVDFGMAQIFDSATTYTNILLLSKSVPANTIKLCRIKKDYHTSILLEDYIDFASVEVANPGENTWIAYDKKEYELIKKIVAQGKPLNEWKIQINRGILTGFNEAFIIDTQIRNKLVEEDPCSAEIIKPILRGEDIKAYVPAWAGLWVIGTFPALKINIEQYPAIEKYLNNFKEKLMPKPRNYNDDKQGKWKGRKNGSYKWFETQDNISYYKDFLSPKIIYPNMTKFMPFVYDKHQFFTNQKCFIITGKHLGFLTAFFNSRIFRFVFKEYFPELLGDTRELSKVFFETATVKTVDDSTNKIFENLVHQIEEIKKVGKNTIPFEQLIEQKLAELYLLSATDMLLIESSEKLSGSSDERIIERSASVSS
ncbi:MAG: class SAM-dependent methyltransferase [Chitinophagaceae bacterium]|nr:class SAM-dependent methyltransferase [Chitinophagaceae bacterium]